MIVFFGSLTILLQDEQFIKLKPTVLYLVLALVLFVPQFFNKYLIKNLLEKQISLPTRVWKQLNISWVLFFVFLGCLNYYVAQSFSTDFWVEFKLFGMLGITLTFTIAQAFWLSRYKNEK
jgi:intracellular septation protein